MNRAPAAGGSIRVPLAKLKPPPPPVKVPWAGADDDADPDPDADADGDLLQKMAARDAEDFRDEQPEPLEEQEPLPKKSLFQG